MNDEKVFRVLILDFFVQVKGMSFFIGPAGELVINGMDGWPMIAWAAGQWKHVRVEGMELKAVME